MSSLVLPNLGLKDHVGLPAYLHGEERVEEEEVGKEVEVARKRNGFCLGDREETEESSESSSIGAPSSSSSSSSEKDASGQGEEEVESKTKDGAVGSWDSLEDSLPIKRGLSNFFSGKSKSFASLADVAIASSRDIAKPENPFNKRRRLLMMSKMRRASCSSLICPPLPPLLSLAHTVEEADEEEEEEEDEENGHGGGSSRSRPPSSLQAPFARHHRHNHHHGNHNSRRKPFRSPRSFSLSDLQHVN